VPVTGLIAAECPDDPRLIGQTYACPVRCPTAFHEAEPGMPLLQSLSKAEQMLLLAESH